jgi:hypothetical protein
VNWQVVERDLSLGAVYGPDGTALPHLATFIGRHRVIVRGSENVKSRRCEQCGRVAYYASGKRYLFPAPRDDADLLDGGNGRLVVSDAVFANIDVKVWARLGYEHTPVVEEPLDGLGDLTGA